MDGTVKTEQEASYARCLFSYLRFVDFAGFPAGRLGDCFAVGRFAGALAGGRLAVVFGGSF